MSLPNIIILLVNMLQILMKRRLPQKPWKLVNGNNLAAVAPIFRAVPHIPLRIELQRVKDRWSKHHQAKGERIYCISILPLSLHAWNLWLIQLLCAWASSMQSDHLETMGYWLCALKETSILRQDQWFVSNGFSCTV